MFTLAVWLDGRTVYAAEYWDNQIPALAAALREIVRDLKGRRCLITASRANVTRIIYSAA